MDFEERAHAVLPPHISVYYTAPASSEVDLDEGNRRVVGNPVPALARWPPAHFALTNGTLRQLELTLSDSS